MSLTRIANGLWDLTGAQGRESRRAPEAGPGVGLHFSADGGLNWDEGTMIDFPESFNGSAIEIEPDVILLVYPESMDEIRPWMVRAQRIGLRADGPVPLGTD